MDDYLKSLDEDYRRRRAIQRELDKTKDDTVIDENGNELIFEKHESDLLKPKNQRIEVCSLENMMVDISEEMKWLGIEPEQETVKKDSPWISVKDRLPETKESVLIRLKNNKVHVATYDHLFGIPMFGPKCWCDAEFGFTVHDKDDVTHWMEIPKL